MRTVSPSPARARAALLRQLEAALRKRNGRAEEIRWNLRQSGMSLEEIWAFERTIRRLIREERTPRSTSTR